MAFGLALAKNLRHIKIKGEVMKILDYSFMVIFMSLGLFQSSNVFAQSKHEGHIVVLKNNLDAQNESKKLASLFGLKVGRVYNHSIKGFFVTQNLPDAALNALKKDKRVAYIERNGIMKKSQQQTPLSLLRTETDRAVAIDGISESFSNNINVAILDTGIDNDHPDLNINRNLSIAFVQETKGKPQDRQVLSYTSPDQWDDRDGHGTHVSGTVAAVDNQSGVVGVAQGVSVAAVKVLNDDGSGTYAQVIAGIDYVAQNSHVFSVANMSLGGGKSTSVNQAVAAAVSQGVIFVVAAGNEATDASTKSPASEPLAITVSAIADTDGTPGGLGLSTSYGDDDSFASFSNYGSIVDVAAPGVGILSTWNNGDIYSISGTSMASPHVAGAIALYIAVNGRDINKDGVLNELDSQAMTTMIRETGTFDFTNDPDNTQEPLINVGNLLNQSNDQKPVVIILSPSSGEVLSGTVVVSAQATDDSSVVKVEFKIDDQLFATDTISEDGFSASLDTLSLEDGVYTLNVVATDDVGQSTTSQIMIEIDNVDSAPIANAGVDILVTDRDGNNSESVTLDGSNSTDDRAILSYTWLINGSVVASGVNPTITLSIGTHIINLIVEDSIGQISQDSVTVTVEPAPLVGTEAIITAINYEGFGGKNSDKNLSVSLGLIDDLDNPAVGAVVSSQLYLDGVLVATSTRTTDESGQAILFDFRGIPNGTYQTVIKSISSSSLEWNQQTPDNQFVK